MRSVAYYHSEYDPFVGKFLNALVRFRRQDLDGVLSFQPTDTLRRYAESNGIPIFTDISMLPPSTKRIIIAALQLPLGSENLDLLLKALQQAVTRGIWIQNGTHTRIAELLPQSTSLIQDLRNVTYPKKYFSNRLAEKNNQLRILTVGMDNNVGKMTTALEIEVALRNQGLQARFIATGQIGISICGKGVVLDATVADHTSGILEEFLLQCEDPILLIEGQGSIFNPFGSGIALAQLHGSVPQQLILCGDLARKSPRHHPSIMLPPYRNAIKLLENLARIVEPQSKVVGLSLNTQTVNEAHAIRKLNEIEQELGLPATDCVRFGSEKLLKPILSSAR